MREDTDDAEHKRIRLLLWTFLQGKKLPENRRKYALKGWETRRRRQFEASWAANGKGTQGCCEQRR